MRYFDCLIREPALAGKVLEYGWDGACVAKEFDGRFKESAKSQNTLQGAILSKEVGKNAKKALDTGADLVFVLGGPEEVNREAAESWEVDVLLSPERGADHDFMDQKNSGLDHITAKLMAERGIMLGITLSDLLEVSGGRRVQLLGRVGQNIMLAQKYKVPLVYCSNATSEYGLRAPRDVIALLSLLGVAESNKVVSENPALLFQKAADRKDPSILTKGLKVVSWGDALKPESKKRYGWL